MPGQLLTANGQGMTDFRASMRVVSCPARAQQILGKLQGRLADVEFVGWPRLAASLRAELADVQVIAQERGLV